MKSRDDIDLERTWLIADTHFGHRNIISYCHRPENFEDILLEGINATVRPGDTLLHLGDLCYKGNAWFKNVIAPKIAPEAGRKLLILGNHDHQRYSFYKQSGWKPVSPFWLPLQRAADGGVEVCPHFTDLRIHSYIPWIVSFSHYAWGQDEVWARPPQNHWRIHGHIHNNGYYDGRAKFLPGTDERGLLRGMDDRIVPYLRNHINVSCEMTKYKPVNLKLLLDAVLLGEMPGGETPGDGEAPSRSDLGGENPHG